MKKQLKVYLSASISNAANNEYICSFLSPDDFDVFLPQKITPVDLNHANYPFAVYEKCLHMMQESDIGLLLLDSYGRDCAWEAGWYAAQANKILVAFVEASSHFTRDWMIKGGIELFITTNPRLLEYAKSDPILNHCEIKLIKDLSELGKEIIKISNSPTQ